MATLSKLLHMTAAEVDNLRFSIYLEWCGRMCNQLGYNPQSVVANAAIARWFSLEFGMLEYQVYKTLLPTYGEMISVKARTIYGAITSDIYKSYPKPLLDAAAKLEIINIIPHDPTAN